MRDIIAIIISLLVTVCSAHAAEGTGRCFAKFDSKFATIDANEGIVAVGLADLNRVALFQNTPHRWETIDEILAPSDSLARRVGGGFGAHVTLGDNGALISVRKHMSGISSVTTERKLPRIGSNSYFLVQLYYYTYKNKIIIDIPLPKQSTAISLSAKYRSGKFFISIGNFNGSETVYSLFETVDQSLTPTEGVFPLGYGLQFDVRNQFIVATAGANTSLGVLLIDRTGGQPKRRIQGPIPSQPGIAVNAALGDGWLAVSNHTVQRRYERTGIYFENGDVQTVPVGGRLRVDGNLLIVTSPGDYFTEKLPEAHVFRVRDGEIHPLKTISGAIASTVVGDLIAYIVRDGEILSVCSEKVER